MLTTDQTTDTAQSPETPEPRADVGSGRRLPRLSVPQALVVLLVLVDIAVPAIKAWETALTVPTFHLDGKFQTASGMFRLAQGDVPGRDFYPYLGIGPIFLLFPLFLLLGGKLTASVFAAQFMSLLATESLVGVVVCLMLRRRSVRVFALAAAVPLVVLAVNQLWPAYTAVEPACGHCLSLMAYATDPGNSLRPLRAIAPYVLTAIATVALRGTWRQRTRMLVIGASAGVIAALWSNDYGLISGALMVALVAGLQLLSRRDGWIRSIVLLCGSALAAFFGSGFLATLGSFLPYLKYNLSDVRGDQFWYFGAWDVQYKIFSVGDLVRDMYHENALPALVVLAAVLVVAYRRRSIAWLLVGYLGTATFLGGVIGTIGGHVGYYFWAFSVWGSVAGAVGLVLLVRYELVLHRPSLAGFGRNSAVARRLTVIATVAALLGVTLLTVTDAARMRAALASDDRYTYDQGFGGYLDAQYAAHVKLARQLPDRPVEEYFGLLGVADGPETDLKVDAVIHALGQERSAFAARMAKHPEHVITTAPENSLGWAAWNMSANWWFYRDLVKSYAPKQDSPMTLVWSRAQPATWQSVPCHVKGYHVELSAASSGLYEVALNYRGPGRNGRAFSMVQNYFNAPLSDGYLALDPGATSQSFPVYVHDPGTGVTELAMKDVPRDGGRHLTTLNGCTASAIAFPEGADTMNVFGGILRANNTLPYWGTPLKANIGKWWRGGINTDHAAFIVPKTTNNLSALLAAHTVRFANGDTRTIERLAVTSTLINVRLSGATLTPDEAAYPHPFWLGN